MALLIIVSVLVVEGFWSIFGTQIYYTFGADFILAAPLITLLLCFIVYLIFSRKTNRKEREKHSAPPANGINIRGKVNFGASPPKSAPPKRTNPSACSSRAAPVVPKSSKPAGMSTNDMSLEERANAGDVEAMLQLADFAKQKDPNTAIDWADKAAETGDANGIYKAVVLHSHRLSMVFLSGLPYWGIMKEDAQAIQKNANALQDVHKRALINLSKDNYRFLLKALEDARYAEAICCYIDDSGSDYARVIHLLSGTETPRAQALCGICCMELQQYDKGLQLLNAVYQNDAYNAGKKSFFEECIYVIAMQALSASAREGGHPEKAIAILTKALNCTSNKDFKAQLEKELSRYKKKAFGGWRYE